MYYDMVISEVKRDVKAEDVTFNLKLMLRLNFTRINLAAQSRSREFNKSEISHGTKQDMDICAYLYASLQHFVCVCVQKKQRCACKHKRGTWEVENPMYGGDTERGVPQCGSISTKCLIKDTNKDKWRRSTRGQEVKNSCMINDCKRRLGQRRENNIDLGGVFFEKKNRSCTAHKLLPFISTLLLIQAMHKHWRGLTLLEKLMAYVTGHLAWCPSHSLTKSLTVTL